MKIHEKILITGTIAIGLAFGLNQYVNGQNAKINDIKKWMNTGELLGKLIIKDAIKDFVVYGRPTAYTFEENTLYVTLGSLAMKGDTRTENFIFEMKARSEDKPLIKVLLDAELNNGSRSTIKLHITEEYNGRSFSADAIFIGFRGINNYFESPNN